VRVIAHTPIISDLRALSLSIVHGVEGQFLCITQEAHKCGFGLRGSTTRNQAKKKEQVDDDDGRLLTPPLNQHHTT
jgi:hypothetical protein